MSHAASAAKPAATPRRLRDLAIGIAVGLVLGIAIVTAFVILGSEVSVDAPRISGTNTATHIARGAGATNATNLKESRSPSSRPGVMG